MKRKRTHTILATITLISVILTSACTAGSANSTTSSAPETAVTTTAPAVTGTVMDRIDEPKAETTTAQTTAITAVTTTKPQETKSSETTTTTTKAVTTAKPKLATTTTAATTKPAPEWTETKASGTKYVNTDCYSRKKAVLGADTVKLYSVNDKVTVTAKTDTGYFKLSDGSFIHSDYLSDNKVAQTTTTTKKAETPKPAEGKKVNFTVVTVRENVPFYSDINCTNATSWVLGEGCEYTVVEVFDSKNCYKLSNGEYVKKEDVKKGKVSDIYRYPFDLEAIRQVIIDDAVNNYGLILAEDIIKDESSWSAPTVISKDMNPSVIARNVKGIADADFKWSQMKKGDYFNVYIETIPDLKKDENGNSIEGYAIFFLR